MADEVINRKNELIVNSVRYPIVGEVIRRLTSSFPPKQVIGSYGIDSMENIDTWEVPLYPGYVGVQEDRLVNNTPQARSWWTNLITEQDGYTVLPRLATSLAIPTIATPTVVNADIELETGWTLGDYLYATGDPHGGLQHLEYSRSGTVGNHDCYQDLTGYTAGARYTVTVYAKRTVTGDYAGTAQLLIDDGVTTSTADTTSSTSYDQLSVTYTLLPTATRFRIILRTNISAGTSGAITSRFDDVALTKVSAPGTPNVAMNFGGNLYWGFGSCLGKLAADRSEITQVYDFIATITALQVGTNGNLMIFLGDATNYRYMTTAEALTTTNVSDANLSTKWDNKMWKMDTDGNWWYSTNGDNSATPTWTAGGALADIADQVETLFLGYDSDGNTQIYCATNSILKVYDSTNAKWIDTEIKLPDHPNGGKGAAYWSGGHYVSYGLGVIQYEPIQYLAQEVGLIKDDGIPSEYNGEIVKFGAEAASNVLYALIDASQTSGNSKSGLWVYDKVGWRCWWVDTDNNGAMHDVVVSSASSGYAVYWDCGGEIFYIDLQRGIQNPRQLAGTITYDTSGIYVSPNYDAYWPVGNKIAVQARCSVRGDVSADETVTVKYRTNHSNETIASGWTTLGSAITSAGETSLPFPNSSAPAGTSFRTIQFGLDFVRAAASTTQTPVVVYLALDYYKVIPKSWGWAATLDLSKASYGDKSSEQLIDLIITAAETESLVTLVYEDTTKYVRIVGVELSHTTGEYPKGTAKILVTEI